MAQDRSIGVLRPTTLAVVKAAGKFGEKELPKLAGKAVAKKIPFFGVAAGIAFAAGRIFTEPTEPSSYFLAAGEVLSGLVSIVPGYGTVASVFIDSALLGVDLGMATGKTSSPTPHSGDDDRKGKTLRSNICLIFSHGF